MSRIFITGSVDGLGQLAAKKLVNLGHQMVLHARNAPRAEYALSKVPGAENLLIAVLQDLFLKKCEEITGICFPLII